MCNELINLQQGNPSLLSMLGNLNAAIESHEKFGRCPPKNTSTNEFLSFTNQNELMHLDNNGSYYTWTNGRKDGAYYYIRLDRSICNQNW